jgi:hypothetical protein
MVVLLAAVVRAGPVAAGTCDANQQIPRDTGLRDQIGQDVPKIQPDGNIRETRTARSLIPDRSAGVGYPAGGT